MLSLTWFVTVVVVFVGCCETDLKRFFCPILTWESAETEDFIAQTYIFDIEVHPNIHGRR